MAHDRSNASETDRGEHEDGRGKLKMPPLFLRYYAFVPSAPCQSLWDMTGDAVESPGVHDVPQLYDMARLAYGYDPRDITPTHYDRARAENGPGRGMYPQWIMDIPTLARRVGARVLYCVQPELHGGTVLWPGLPCMGRTIEPDAIGDADHPRFIGKTMIGVVERKDPPLGDARHMWVLTLACGRVCAVPKKLLRRLLSSEMRGPVYRRHDVVTRLVGPKGQTRTLPYLPPWCYSPNSRKKPKLDDVPPPSTDTNMSSVTAPTETARQRNMRMYNVSIDQCTALQLEGRPPPAKVRKVDSTPEPAPAPKSDEVAVWLRRFIDMTKKRTAVDGVIPRGAGHSSIVRGSEEEAEKQCVVLLNFLRYYDHVFKNTEEVQSHPLVGRDSVAPGDGTPGGFVGDPHFGEAFRLFAELFVAGRKVDAAM
jgi:hypothetical protein